MANADKVGEDTTGEWTVLSEAMAEHDTQMIQDWKDDLGNLLIFAGLFSSVVAGFAIESYGSLQQDTSNPDATVLLLAQISTQLASFSTAQGFINSTTVPAPSSTFITPSGPSELDVRVNILWFLSLGVSLTASLLAIIVQQWLREYRLPAYVSIRERIRLRQYRFEAFEEWGVPQIVSMLPLLLQVALILFLVGLCYLLDNLDRTVAKTFIAFVGIALSAYFALTVLPIAFRRCPYKNPFARGFIVTAKVVGRYAVLTTFVVVATLALLLVVLPVRLLDCTVKTVRSAHLIVEVYRFVWSFVRFTSKFRNAHSDLGGHLYWTARDLDGLFITKHLDRNALVWAPSGLSTADLARMDRCLGDLPASERIACVCAWVAQALNLSKAALGHEESFPFGTATLAKIDHTFSDRFRHSLLSVMPDNLVYDESQKEFFEPGVLVVLRHIALLKPADAEWTAAYARKILNIRSTQRAEDFEMVLKCSWTRLPTACIFELSTTLQYEFDADDVPNLFDYAIQNYDILVVCMDDPIFFVSCLDQMFGSYATALYALSRQRRLSENQSVREKCLQLLEKLKYTLASNQDAIRRQGTFALNYFDDGVPLVFISACNSLCKSVVSLAQQEALPFNDNSVLSPLLDALTETFQDQHAFEEGCKTLMDYKTAYMQAGVSSSSGKDAKDAPALPSDAEIMDGASIIEVGSSIVAEVMDGSVVSDRRNSVSIPEVIEQIAHEDTALVPILDDSPVCSPDS